MGNALKIGLLPVGIALVVACDGGAADVGPDPTTGGTTVAADLFSGVSVELSPVVPTVAVVSWTTDLPTIGTVSFWEGDSHWETDAPTLWTVSELAPSVDHRALLVGLPEGVEAGLQLHATTDAGTISSDQMDFTTGILSAAIPRPVLSVGTAQDSAGGYTILPMARETERWTTVVDASGRLVWAFGGGELTTQRARLTLDGQGIVMTDRQSGADEFALVRIDFDGTERWRLPVVNGHHDFDLVDDETFLVLATVLHDIDSPSGIVTMVSDQLVEVDLAGGRRELWDAWDHLDVDVTAPWLPSDTVAGALDWSHGNYVRYDRDTDGVQLTLRGLAAAVEVDRATGETHWMIAPGQGDYDDLTKDGVLSYPHSVWPIEGGLLVFNQREPNRGQCAEAAMLRLDDDLGTVERFWTYPSDTCRLVGYLGNAQPLAMGRTLVSFGMAGAIEEFDGATGGTPWRLTVDAATWLLYAERFAGFGTNQP